MNYPKDDNDIDDLASLNKKSKKLIKKKEIENENESTNLDDDSNSSSFSNKKYGKKKYSLKENSKTKLFIIKEEDKTNSKNKKLKINNGDKIGEDEIDKSINNIINKSLNKQKNKDKEIKTVTLSDEEESIIILSDEESNNKDKGKKSKPKNIKKNKKEENGLDSRINSKNKIDLEFLTKDEQKLETKDDFKSYIQEAFDDEGEYKITYEFNHLPYKPKNLIFNLNVFDDDSLLKCITNCYFDKQKLKFIFNLNFVYLSTKSKIYRIKYNDEILMNYFTEQEQNKNKEETINDKKENKNDITLKITIKRFNISKGYENLFANSRKTIKKKDEFDGFDKIEYEQPEELVNYKNYHKIFYILTIKKINITKSRKNSLSINKIGIQNEGNTCYMNSIIQSIYNNPFLLKNIMEINTNSEILSKEENGKSKDIILALQKILYKLNTEKISIKILEIFYAFQWKRVFWNSPQDVEEIYMQIYEIISAYNENIKNNCEGILENTIEVKEIEHKSTQEEKFFFLQLDIENNNSLEECLENFFKGEELSGENRYQYIDNLGKKNLYDANRFYKFKKIPYILFIQLKRFQYNPTEITYDKKNNAISFKEEIDLTKYIYNNKTKSKSKTSKKKKQEKEENQEYILYCVIVHSGSSENGHYYCYVKDFQNDCYIKFNDTSVYEAEIKEVFNYNFGGEEIEYLIKNRKTKKSPDYEVIENKIEIKKNAYIFIYIKKSRLNDLFSEKNEEIKKLFENYAKKEEEKLKVKNKKNKKQNERKTINLKYSNNIQYNYDLTKKQNKRTTINMNITGIDFENTLSEMGNCIQQCETLSKQKNNISKKLILKKKGTNFIRNKKSSKKRVPPMNYPNNILNKNTYYYLVDDISKKIKGIFLFSNYKDLKVKDIPQIIKEELVEEKDKKILKKIVNSTGYKITLINAFGFFIKFLDNQEENISDLLLLNDFNDEIKGNHICLYDFEEIYRIKNIKNIIVINFIPSYALDLIISKNKDIYSNFNFYNINIPTYIINEKIQDINDLIKKIKDAYKDYFNEIFPKNRFKIYVINNKDILNKDIFDINYVELTDDNYILYGENAPNQNICRNLLIGI